MSMHTPGPWKATKDPHGSSNDYCIGMETDVARIDRVAVCGACDARLIASAPELLEALQAILPFIPITSAMEGGASAYSENVRAADKVRSAIAKATGATP